MADNWPLSWRGHWRRRVGCQAATASEQQTAGGQNIQLSWRPSIGVGSREVMPSLNFLFLYSFCLFSATRAQSISTSTPVPPLQWINLTSLLQGSSAPPLKDASIGYDNSTRTLIIFGGESQGGLPQQQAYLSVFPFLLLITFFDIHSSYPASTWILLSGLLQHLKAEILLYHPQEVRLLEVATSPRASRFTLHQTPESLLSVSQVVVDML